MDFRTRDDGSVTFLEHWGVACWAVALAVMVQLPMLFRRLSVEAWLWFCGLAFAITIFGGFLVCLAKFPSYRKGQILSFGLRSVPERLKNHYIWGWRFFMCGAVLLVGFWLT